MDHQAQGVSVNGLYSTYRLVMGRIPQGTYPGTCPTQYLYQEHGEIHGVRGMGDAQTNSLVRCMQDNKQ